MVVSAPSENRSTAKVLLHPVVAVQPGYDFLTDIAALGKVNCSYEAGLQRVIRLPHLAAEGWIPAQDAQGLPLVGIGCHSPGLGQRSGHSFGGIGGRDQQTTRQVAQRAADGNGNRAADADSGRRIDSAGQVLGFVSGQAEGGVGPGSGESDDGGGPRNVLYLQVFHNGVLVQPLDYGLLLAGTGEQQDVVSGTDDTQQVHDASPVAGQHGGRPVTWLQVVNLVGGKPVEQVQRVLARGLQAAVVGVMNGQRSGRGRGNGAGRLGLAGRVMGASNKFPPPRGEGWGEGANTQAPPSLGEDGACAFRIEPGACVGG